MYAPKATKKSVVQVPLWPMTEEQKTQRERETDPTFQFELICLNSLKPRIEQERTRDEDAIRKKYQTPSRFLIPGQPAPGADSMRLSEEQKDKMNSVCSAAQ